jgi:hypothetical protein
MFRGVEKSLPLSTKCRSGQVVITIWRSSSAIAVGTSLHVLVGVKALRTASTRVACYGLDTDWARAGDTTIATAEESQAGQ